MLINTFANKLTSFDTIQQGHTFRFSLQGESVEIHVESIGFDVRIGHTEITGQCVPMKFEIAGELTPAVLALTPVLLEVLQANDAHHARIAIEVRELVLLIEYNDSAYMLSLFDQISPEAILRLSASQITNRLLARRQDAELLKALVRLPWAAFTKGLLTAEEANAILAEVVKQTVHSTEDERIYLGRQGWVRETYADDGIHEECHPVLMAVESHSSKAEFLIRTPLWAFLDIFPLYHAPR